MIENQNTRQVYWWLGGLGVIPFAAAPAFTISLAEGHQVYQQLIDQALVMYGVMIASFLTGTQWMIHLMRHQQTGFRFNLLIVSNVLVVLLWASAAFGSEQFVYAVTLLTLWVLLWLDWRNFQEQVISSSYFVMRVTITAMVSLCLNLSIILS